MTGPGRMPPRRGRGPSWRQREFLGPEPDPVDGAVPRADGRWGGPGDVDERGEPADRVDRSLDDEDEPDAVLEDDFNDLDRTDLDDDEFDDVVDAELVEHDDSDHHGYDDDGPRGEANLHVDGAGVVAIYRPVVGRALAESPLTLGAWAGRQLAVAVRGAAYMATAWHHWVKVEEDRRALDARTRLANRQDMVVTEGDRKAARDTESKRGQRSASLLAVAILALFAVSASWSWGWLSWVLLVGGVGTAGARKWTKPWGPWVGLPVALGAPALAVTSVSWVPLACAAAALLSLCWVVGRWVTDPDDGKWAPPVLLGPDTSARALTKTVVDVLEATKPPVHGLQVYGSTRREHSITLETNAIGALTDEHLRALERAVGAGWGRVTSIPDPENSAHRQLTFRWRDPLARFPSLPSRGAGTIDATQPIALGVDENGEVVAATFAGRHVLIDGISGSGKSGLTLVALDALCSADNGRVFGIDLTGGPELEAVEPNLVDYAIDEHHAARILDTALAEIERRIGILREGVRQRRRGEHIDRAWTCTTADPAWFVVIDEFPTLAEHPALLRRVNRIMRVGRKARVTLVVITQDPTRQAMAGTVVTKGAMVRVALAMPGDHIRFVLGDGAAALGYRPDLLTPSDDVSGQVNDAGKFYLRAGGARVPILARAFGLDLDTAADRALDRAEAAARLEAEVADAVEVPPVLAALEAAFDARPEPDREFLPTRDAVAATGMGQKALANALAPHGMFPGKRPGGGSNAPRGYTRSSLVAALRDLG